MKKIPGNPGHMSVDGCIIRSMTKWNKYSYLNTDNDCLIEVTHLEGTEERILYIPLNEPPYILLSVEDATIHPMSERKEMETVSQDTYNPHTIVTLRKIDTVSGTSIYTTYKATDLEVLVDESSRRINLLEQRLEAQEKQLGQILNKMTPDEWYSSNTDKSEILSDLCDILGYEPKQTLRITANVLVEVEYDCPLEEVEDFDAKYFLQDNLTIDAFHGDIVVDSFDVEDADVNW